MHVSAEQCWRCCATGVALLAWVEGSGGAAHQLAASSAANPVAMVATAALLQIDGTLGGWSSPCGDSDHVIKPDLVGQLVDPVAVDIQLPSPALPEESSLTANARLMCDDQTILDPIGPPDWRIEEGPAAVSTGGLVTASAVYENTSAVLRVNADGLAATTTVAIVNADPDNYGLYGRDAIDDAWQQQYFGVSNVLGAARADPDADGYDNYFEFTAGTSPDSATDYFRMALQKGTNIGLAFQPARAGRAYTVDFTTNLTAGAWAPLASASTQQVADVRIVTDTQMVYSINNYRVAIRYDWRTSP